MAVASNEDKIISKNGFHTKKRFCQTLTWMINQIFSSNFFLKNQSLLIKIDVDHKSRYKPERPFRTPEIGGTTPIDRKWIDQKLN
jgi:hypothetical protein